MKKIFAAILASAATVTGAQAAESQVFDGPYIGVQIGSVGRSLDFSLDDPMFVDSKDSQDGFEYGLFVGHDWISGGKFVFGVEAGAAKGAPELYSSASNSIILYTSPKWSYDLSARAGIKASHNVLLYGRAGYGSERVAIGGFVRSTPNNPILGRYEETGWSEGLLLGGGVEIALIKSASIRAEYRHREMKESYGGHQILAGLAYRF